MPGAPPGGHLEPTWIGSKPDALPPIWQRVSDAAPARARRQGGEVTTSLRQTIFQAVFTELINRTGKLNIAAKDDALVQGLKAKGILTEDLKWQYLSWNPEAKALQPNQKQPLTSEDVCQTLRRIHQLGENPPVLKFAALRPL